MDAIYGMLELRIGEIADIANFVNRPLVAVTRPHAFEGTGDAGIERGVRSVGVLAVGGKSARPSGGP